MSLGPAIRRFLPRALQLQLKKMYYPRVLRRFDEARWPGAEIVQRLIQPGDTVVDAGANIGYVSMLLARWVGPTGRVISFEPVPDTFALLAHNMKALRLAQVTPTCAALSSQPGEADMYVPNYESGGENFYESHLGSASTERSERRVRVRITTLDDEIKFSVRFIKMDVEGHEEEALKGATRILRESRPALFVEMTDAWEGEGQAARVAAELAKLGYRPYVLEQGNLRLRRHGDSSVDYFFLTPEHETTAVCRGS